jgi:glutathione reductase (NADPH)
MARYDYDLFVIGAGSGGVRAARIAAGLGARVACAESQYLGGTCVNVGCVPKKLFVYGSRYAEDFDDARAYGWDLGEPRFDWARLLANKDDEIGRLNGIYLRLLENAGVTVLRGRAVVTGPHGVSVDGGPEISAANILVATGSRPYVPGHVPGTDLMMTSDDLFRLESLPERIVVIGGGYIGVEFAGIFKGFGLDVALVHRREHVLSGFDEDVRCFVTDQLQAQGIELHMGQTVEDTVRRGDRLHLTLSTGDELVAGAVLCAVGRVPNTHGLGLEACGVQLDERDAIVVNEHFQSNVPSIYAVGDVIDRHQLTPVALAEGQCVARNLFSGNPAETVAYEQIPTAVFCNPPVGTCGLTEGEARERYERVTVFMSEFRPMKHTVTGRQTRTLMKLVVDGATDRVVGCHMVGDDAGEIIQGLAVAMKCGATKAHFDSTIGVHPTAAEEFVTMRKPVR